MDAIKDFESFYTLKIQPFIDDLKSEKKQATKWGNYTIFSIIGGIVILWATIKDVIPASGPSLIFLFIILFGYSLYNFTTKQESFEDNFKSKVIKEIVDFLRLDIIYKPEDCISKRDYKSSGLYRQIFADYEGNDFLEGIYRNVSFQCSELFIHFDSTNAPATADTYKIFKGLFFVAKVSSQFTGGTYVWIKGEEQLPTSIMDEEYRLMYLPDVNKFPVKDPDFNKHFSAYTTFPSQARSILTEAMIEHFVKFRNQLRRDFQFSIVAGKCFVAIPFNEDLLETLDTDSENKEDVKQYFFTILLVLSIINQLHLNNLVD